MPRILITGADGFIGRHLVAFPGLHKHEILCTSQHSRADRRMLLLQGAGTDWASALEGADVLVHLAGIAHREGVTAAQHHDIAVESCAALVRALPDCPTLKQIIFLSTAKIWGEESGGLDDAFTDETPPAPADGYARAKYAAEQMLMAQGRVPVIALRPPLVYGAGVKANFARLLGLCANGLPGGIPLPLGSIRNQRHFLDVLALCDAIVRIIDHAQTGPIHDHRAFGIADRDGWTTPYLLRFLTHALQGRLRLMPFPPILLSTGATVVGKSRIARQLMGNFRMDCRNLAAEYNWQPPRDSQTALKKLADLFHKNSFEREKFFQRV